MDITWRGEPAEFLKKLSGCRHPIILPLGGIGRIGLNWTLYGHLGRWVLVDAGIGFPGPGEEGDFLIPDGDLVRSIAPLVRALIVTHAHEDHIGAIHHLWPSHIRAPIHATPFAAEMLRGRLREAGTLPSVEIREFRPGDSFAAARFAVDTLPVTHSAPECVALRLRAGGVTLVHTGDWKDDVSPMIGPPTDWAMLGEWGRAGVDALLGDSTNADRSSPPTSESDVLDGLDDIMASAPGMVVVATFGSNVGRIVSAAKAAARNGRVAAMMGRSVRNAEDVARRLGMLGNAPEFLCLAEHLNGLDRRETVLVCTGTQGEENAALARLARGDGSPAVARGDTVVLSARIIPGREEAVAAVIDALRRRGATVLTGRDSSPAGHPLHVTGHATSEEIARLHDALRPAVVIPIHGEPGHLDAHGRIAEGGGFPWAILSPGEAREVMSGGRLIPRGRMDVPIVAQERPDQSMPFRRRRG